MHIPLISIHPPTRHNFTFQAHLKSQRDLSLASTPPAAAAAAAGAGAGGSAAPAAQPAAAGGQAAGQPAGAAEDPPFPAAALLQILRVTALILEGCSNKHLYNSYEVSAFFIVSFFNLQLFTLRVLV